MDIPNEVRELFRKWGRRGGKIGGPVGGPLGGRARAKKLSPQRRKSIARKAASTRWRKAGSRKKP